MADRSLVHSNVVHILPPSDPKVLAQILPQAERRLNTRLVRVNGGLLPDQIHLVRLDELGLLEELPEGEQHEADEYHGVVRKERTDIPPSIRELESMSELQYEGVSGVIIRRRCSRRC